MSLKEIFLALARTYRLYDEEECMKLVWHIVRKDFRHLRLYLAGWLGVLIVAPRRRPARLAPPCTSRSFLLEC